MGQYLSTAGQMADSNAHSAVDPGLVSSQTIGRRKPWVPPVREVFGSGSMCSHPRSVRRMMPIRDQIRRSPSQMSPNSRPPAPTSAHYARHDGHRPQDAPPASPRLHVVTGKGGTGKTTLAGALAIALAAEGRKVLLCEVEGRQGIASLFDVAPLPYGERRIALGLDHGEVFALAIDPEAALLEYLDLFYRLGRAGKALDRFGVIDFATTVAPGVRDVLVVGKVYEATRRGAPGRSARAAKGSQASYDAVVLDAPPTGRIGRFLNVNTEVAGIAKVGPIRNQASSIMRLLKSDVTTVHVVTTLEEMPVQETLDGIDELHEIGLGVGAVLVNQVRGSDLSSHDLRAAAPAPWTRGRWRRR